jgi:hypothetical protein
MPLKLISLSPTPQMDDPTPINARPKRRPPEPVEDATLALREHLLWPLEDRFVALDDGGRGILSGGALLLAILVGLGGFFLVSSGGSKRASAPVAVAPKPLAESAPASEPKPAPKPTLHGATPVFKAPASTANPKVSGSEAAGGEAPAPAAAATHTGSAATDTISSSPAARAATASHAGAEVSGPPAGPAAISVARKFAGAFVVYETGGEKGVVRKTFSATATPELTKALLHRPPHQPAGVEVPKAKVLNVVPAPSHGTVYPLSVSLLRVGVTSELRLEMEQLKDKQWRVTNVLG